MSVYGQCDNPIPVGDDTVRCDHPAIGEGRYCTCCEYMAGLLSMHDAVQILHIPHLHVPGGFLVPFSQEDDDE